MTTPDTEALATAAPEPAATWCGLVAIVGRPNVGKSTLLNALVGQKVSITSRKAQTTRHRITGIRTEGDHQFIFVDTPGFQTRRTAALNRTLNKTVVATLSDVDIVIFVTEAGRWGSDDDKVIELLGEARASRPVVLVGNKTDAIKRRDDLLPWLQHMQDRYQFEQLVPISAKKKADVDRLLKVVAPYLPQQAWLHEADALTDRNERFLASEIVREKVFRLMGDELPYTCTVVIDSFEEEPGIRADRMVRIAATVVVEREAHKGMVIGQGGERLKRMGEQARKDLEALLAAKVFLQLWVKVRSGWADDEQHLRAYGYGQ